MNNRKKRRDFSTKNNDSDRPIKKQASSVDKDGSREALLASLKKRRAEAAAERQARQSERESSIEIITKKDTSSAPGLNVPLHPLFRDLSKDESVERSSQTTSKSSTPVSNKYLEELENDYNEPNKENLYYENTASSSRSRRARRGLIFNQQGKFIDQANKMRKEAQLQEIQRKVDEATKNSRLETDYLAGERNYRPDQPPSMEWWDEQIMIGDHQSYDKDILNIGNTTSPITIYIQHPVPITAPWEKGLPKETRLFLTKNEFKRIRKNDRAEKHKETQDRIRLGLDPAPPPKIKLSNVMSIFTDEAVKDPTMLEQRAKEAVAERRQKHDEDNQSRKLTPEQQYEKFVAKLEKEKEKGIFTAVFRVENLSDGKHRYLVNYNANKSKFTGIVIFNSKFNLIIVEGGLVSIKKFTRLLMVRIKWTENAPARNEEEASEPKTDLSKNQCTLVWSGQLKSNKFMKWTLRDAETEQDAKDILSRNHAENYWLEARSLDVREEE